MMRLWVERYAVRQSTGASAALSVVVHGALIVLAVAGTQKAAGVAEEVLANRVYFLPPPDRSASTAGQVERISFIQLGVPPIDASKFVDAPTGQSLAGKRDVGPGTLAGLDSITVPELPPIRGNDSVFSVVEVDSAVSRDPASAAPAYPVELLKAGIEGSAYVRYVVDTTGYADTTSFSVLRSTHTLFGQAVRAALPLMHFSPARIGAHAVRQLVEQEFSFKIDPPAGPVTAQAGKAKKRGKLDP